MVRPQGWRGEERWWVPRVQSLGTPCRPLLLEGRREERWGGSCGLQNSLLPASRDEHKVPIFLHALLLLRPLGY